MSARDEVRAHVASATDSVSGITGLRDYRARYIQLGVAGVHALAALALALERFAAAIEPHTHEENE